VSTATSKPPPPLRHRRRGGALVEDMLSLSVVAVGLITAAYVYMPDFERGVKTIAHEVGERVQGW
jgi:hypothetical protein